MEKYKMMPSGYWAYVWGLLILFFVSSYLAFMPGGAVTAIIVSILVAAVTTLWLAVVYVLWFTGGLLYKLLALILGGLAAVLVAIFIQLVYENLVLKRVV